MNDADRFENIPELEALEDHDDYIEAGQEAFRGEYPLDPFDVLNHFAYQKDIEFPKWLVDEKEMRERNLRHYEDFEYALNALERKANEEENYD